MDFTPELRAMARTEPSSASPPAPARNVEVVSRIGAFVGEGRHFIQEDQPEMIGRTLADWRRHIGRD